MKLKFKNTNPITQKELTRSNGAYMRTKKESVNVVRKKSLLDRLTPLGKVILISAIALFTAMVINLIIK